MAYPMCELIDSEGTLEVAPTIGYADLIADLVSTGTTLRDNRLRPLPDGVILKSQAVLIANRAALQTRPEVLQVARLLLEYIEAYLARAGQLSGLRQHARRIARSHRAAHARAAASGRPARPDDLTRDHARRSSRGTTSTSSCAKIRLMPTINELRAIGGSGVVVTPVTYIFEEEPPRYTQLLQVLNNNE